MYKNRLMSYEEAEEIADVVENDYFKKLPKRSEERRVGKEC